ncbi:glycosyltransferase [Rhodophyticola sp. CCM32]|uniref:glycosyltransferase n=1 Tax=Rhodophyticola sp. CCM32 TaxID=2916397 RepID=UPI00143D5B01|nr:glycosyltransferase [Rhodophyticola sp. CCM32]
MAQHDAVHFYLPSFAGGGAERIFIRLANHIASRGRDVHFIVNHEAGPLRDLLSGDVTLHSLGTRRAVQAVPRLVAYLKSARPSVLISALTRTNLAALLAARFARTGTRMIVCERNQYSVFSRGLGPMRRVLITRLVRWLYPKAYAVIGNTAGVTHDIALVAGLEADKTGVIHNPAPDLAQIEAARDEPADHPWLDEDRPVAVAIGRLMPQKDYRTMLAALAASAPDLRLLVLGDGPDRAALEALAREYGISDRVDFLGFRMNRFAYLVRADLFLISSLTEGFPNALIEAVAAGVPAISTDCAGGGAREIMGADFPDRIVPVADAEAMARVIGDVLASRDGAKADLDRQRIAHIARRYEISQIADAFLARAAI